MAHRFYQFFRPAVEATGTVCAVRIAAIDTARGVIPAIDILLAGPDAGVVGPVLFYHHAFELPERTTLEGQALIADVLRTDAVKQQLAAGAGVIWAAHREPFETELHAGGFVPGLTPFADEFAYAMAWRSARTLLEGRRTYEVRAPGFPWAQRYASATTYGAALRDDAAASVRALYGGVSSSEYEPGSAVAMYGGIDVPVLELRGAPLVWIGRQEDSAQAEARLREAYGADVERFAIAQRHHQDFGFFPQRTDGPFVVLLVNSCSGYVERHAPPAAAIERISQPLNVLLIARPDRSNYPIGGVETLLVKTAEMMRERGARVDIQETANPNATGYDVAHIIGGLAEYIVHQGQSVRAAGTPLVMTPVFATYEGMTWFTQGVLAAHSDPRSEEQDRILDAMRQRIATVGEHQPQPATTDFRDLRAMQQGYALADAHLICAQAEAQQMGVRLGVYRPTHYLPNGIDTDVMRPGVERVAIVPKRPYVLMATRIDSQKNLFGVFDAVRSLDLDAVVLGRVDHEFSRLTGIITSNAPQNTAFIPSTPTQAHPWFGSLFANASAVMVPSWSEVFSLNVLDAAACGVPIVMSYAGYHSELLGDLGYYADPVDKDSIADAIRRAVSENAETRARRLELAERVRATHNWHAVADRLLAIYTETARRGPVPLTGIR